MVIISELDAFEGKVFVVTGGSTYLGRRLCQELSRREAKDVRCMGNNFEGCRRHFDAADNISLCEGTLLDHAALTSTLRQADCVFHTFSHGSTPSEALHDSMTHSLNLDGTLLLLQCCLEQGVSQLVYTSSTSVVFGGQPILEGDENLDYFPLESHMDGKGRSQGLAEQMVLKFNGKRHRNGPGFMSTCALRLPQIYGPDEPDLLLRIMAAVRWGAFPFTLGPVDAKLDLVHADNAVHAHCLAFLGLLPEDKGGIPRRARVSERQGKQRGGSAEGGRNAEQQQQQLVPVASGQVYFISDGSPVNFFQFLAPIIKAYGHDPPSTPLPLPLALSLAWTLEAAARICLPLLKALPAFPYPPLRPFEVYQASVSHYFSITKAKVELGYSPLLTSKEGQRNTASYWRGRRSREVSRPSLLTCSLITLGISFLYFSAFTEPPAMGALEPVRELLLILFMARPVLETVWWMSVAIHVAEAVAAWVLAAGTEGERRNAAEWSFQTFLFGMFSLRLLLRKIADREIGGDREAGVEGKGS